MGRNQTRLTFSTHQPHGVTVPGLSSSCVLCVVFVLSVHCDVREVAPGLPTINTSASQNFHLMAVFLVLNIFTASLSGSQSVFSLPGSQRFCLVDENSVFSIAGLKGGIFSIYFFYFPPPPSPRQTNKQTNCSVIPRISASV